MCVPDQPQKPSVDKNTVPPSMGANTSGQSAAVADSSAADLGYIGLPSAGPLSRVLAALQHRNYAILWGSGVLVNIGWHMRDTTVNWLVIDISNSEMLLGTNALIVGLAMLLVLPVGGMLADHFNRRWLLGICYTIGSVATLCLAAMAVKGDLRVWHLIGLSGLIGLLNGVRFPAMNALMASLVSRERITSAVAMLSIEFQLARVIGPLLAGLVFLVFAGSGYMGGACNLALFAASTLIFIVALPCMRNVPKVNKTNGSMIGGIRNGIMHLRGRSDLVYLYMLIVIAAVLSFSFANLVPAYVKKVLEMGADRYTLAMSCAGVGAVIGAVIQALRGNTRSISRFVYIAPMISAVCVTIAGFWMHYVVLIVVAGISSMSFLGVLVAIKSYMMTTTPDHLRGRMSSHLSLCIHIGGPLGAFATGLVAEIFDVMIAYRILGLTVILSLLLTMWLGRRAQA